MAKIGKANFEKPDTIIGEGTEIEGVVLRAKNSIRINGKYKGDMRVEGSVVIGETGSIEGNIWADYIYICGKIVGNIEVKMLAHLSPNAKVSGNIVCGVIVVDEGALLDGKCTMKNSDAPTKKEVQAAK